MGNLCNLPFGGGDIEEVDGGAGEGGRRSGLEEQLEWRGSAAFEATSRSGCAGTRLGGEVSF